MMLFKWTDRDKNGQRDKHSDTYSKGKTVYPSPLKQKYNNMSEQKLLIEFILLIQTTAGYLISAFYYDSLSLGETSM